MILEFIELLVWFFICWTLIFFLHELFHSWACKKYGGKSKIEIWFYKKIIPSMRCSCEAGTGQSINWYYFYYAGGLGAGFISTLASIPFYWIYPPLFIGLFILGIINLFYGIYEGTLKQRLSLKDYMYWHYIVEIAGIIVGIILLRNVIWSWINV